MSSCICKWLPTISTDANNFSAEPERLAQLKLQQQTVALKNGYPGCDKVKCKINNARWVLDQEQFTSTAIAMLGRALWRRLAWDSRRIWPTPRLYVESEDCSPGGVTRAFDGAVLFNQLLDGPKFARNEPLKRKKPRALVALGAFWSRQPA